MNEILADFHSSYEYANLEDYYYTRIAPYLERLVGSPVGIKEAFGVGDALAQMVADGIPIPDTIPSDVYAWLTDTYVNAVVAASTTPEGIKLACSEFFKRLLATFDEIIGGSRVKLNIYVAHAFTVYNFLVGIGA